jgi:probable F420-dependent oxidoreductase
MAKEKVVSEPASGFLEVPQGHPERWLTRLFEPSSAGADRDQVVEWRRPRSEGDQAMKIDTGIGQNFEAIGSSAAALEEAGFDGIWSGETSHDPFLIALTAAQATKTVSVGTSIAIAFARTPMTTASTAYDLAQYSQGRFILGLGSQIKPHIERRFSMPWSHPVARMREYVLAMKAIWSTWQDGTKLSFEGDFYTHTLMTPFFTPAAHVWGPPPVYLAGVGSSMVEAVGEVAEGYFAHAFTTERYVRDHTLPALGRGRAKAGHGSLEDFVVCGSPFVATGTTEAELAQAKKGTRDQIAFYASTPAYEPVLAAHGWEALRPELTALSKQGRWSDMGDLIDDDMLDAFAVVGEPAACGAELARRYGDVFDRVTLYLPYLASAELRAELIDALRGGLSS